MAWQGPRPIAHWPDPLRRILAPRGSLPLTATFHETRRHPRAAGSRCMPGAGGFHSGGPGRTPPVPRLPAHPVVLVQRFVESALTHLLVRELFSLGKTGLGRQALAVGSPPCVWAGALRQSVTTGKPGAPPGLLTAGRPSASHACTSDACAPRTDDIALQASCRTPLVAWRRQLSGGRGLAMQGSGPASQTPPCTKPGKVQCSRVALPQLRMECDLGWLGGFLTHAAVCSSVANVRVK